MRRLVLAIGLLALLMASAIPVTARGEGPRVVCFLRHFDGGSGPRQHPTTVRVCRTFGVVPDGSPEPRPTYGWGDEPFVVCSSSRARPDACVPASATVETQISTTGVVARTTLPDTSTASERPVDRTMAVAVLIAVFALGFLVALYGLLLRSRGR